MVVDEQGKQYEATYPKRAKGLVKNGRARFIDEKTICLACPPNEWEDNEMADYETFSPNPSVEDMAAGASKYTLDYVLMQIERIAGDTGHLEQVLADLAALEPKVSDTPGVTDTAGQAKAQALKEVVQSREATNRQILALYEKMYDDLKPKTETLQDKALALVGRAMECPSLEEKSALSDLLDTIRHLGR